MIPGADQTAPAADYLHLLHERSVAEFPHACVHELFEQQAARTPEAVAVVFGGQEMTYRELNERANQVAHFLLRRCVGPESLVGVGLARTPELVVALLGVWKAGAAYVPLDPADPPERLAVLVEDAELRLLLTDSRSQPLFAPAGAGTVCLDSDWPLIAHERKSNPAAPASPDNLAYVMYTSGSTGRPKGVMVVHSGLVNYLWWAIGAYRLQAGGSVPVHSSIAFDLTVTSLYPPLLVGARIELLPDAAGAAHLLAALRRSNGHSLVKITPAHLELLGRQLTADEMAALGQVFVIGGENLSGESLRRWRRHAPAARLINEYGPTETVVGCCIYEVQPDDPPRGPVPIGRPIANTRLYVLDEAMQPVPPGVAGELYIGGVGVARGYLNRPELTSERFLADPFSSEPAARLFRTGDLARYRLDGTLEYLGRADEQVKVSGYRIEPGEIESSLATHPAVLSCLVMARQDAPGERQLVAYAVVPPDDPPEVAELQEFLSHRLPAYMLPAHIVRLDALPLNRNGKVDRAALPAPSRLDAAAGAPCVAARTAVEARLVALWCKLLRLDRIGIEDDFFALGGRSLQAVRAVAQMRTEFAVDLQLQHLFEQPTIAGLAGLIEGLACLSGAAQPPDAAGPREEIEL